MRSCRVSMVTIVTSLLAVGSAVVMGGPPATAPASPGASAELPVTEVTVFKDGHAFVLQEGRAAVDASGNVTLDRLPQPVLGTFWPFSGEPGAKLVSVTAGNREGSERRPATTIRDMLEANIGASAHIFEVDGRDYQAKITALPRPKSRPGVAPAPDVPAPPVSAPQPEPGSIVVLETENATKVVPIERIRDVLFDAPPTREVSSPRTQGVLTLHLAGVPAGQPGNAQVGYMYLQKGLRWIPNYKVAIDGQGKATISLQATLVNELADLQGVTVHLVVGVPTFTFKETVDPMALQQAVAQLGPHFRSESRTAYAFSNALMSQRMSESPAPEPRVGEVEPGAADAGQQEDLFIFTVKDISLAKGERMVVPIAEYSLSYQDVYVLDIPWSPPVEMRQRMNNSAEVEMAKLTHAPKVMHRLRLTNDGPYPLTTAPALVVQGNRPLAQGMMKYTAVGAATDLDVTTAVDIASSRKDVEAGRTPGAQKWYGVELTKVNMTGTIKLNNRRREAVQVEVVRHVLGYVDRAEPDGEAVQISPEDAWESGAGQPPWWPYYYAWPWWWNGVNGVGEVRWKATLEPGGKTELKYAWHYFWG